MTARLSYAWLEESILVFVESYLCRTI